MAFLIEWVNQIACYEFADEMTDEDMYRSNRLVLDSPYFSTMRGQLINQLNVTKINVSTECMKTIADWDIQASKLNPNVKVAILTSDSTQFGLTRMYEMFSNESSWPIQIFKDKETALNWLS